MYGFPATAIGNSEGNLSRLTHVSILHQSHVNQTQQILRSHWW